MKQVEEIVRGYYNDYQWVLTCNYGIVSHTKLCNLTIDLLSLLRLNEKNLLLSIV